MGTHVLSLFVVDEHVGLGQPYVSHSRLQLEHTFWNTESDTESNAPTELLEDMSELQEEEKEEVLEEVD